MSKFVFAINRESSNQLKIILVTTKPTKSYKLTEFKWKKGKRKKDKIKVAVYILPTDKNIRHEELNGCTDCKYPRATSWL